MFVYEKKLQYPVKIKNPNPKLAAIIISQYGGPNRKELQKRRLKSDVSFILPHSISCDLYRQSSPRRSSILSLPCYHVSFGISRSGPTQLSILAIQGASSSVLSAQLLA